ncbi:uncharacterized protein LOC143658646 isoform X4 [Tamandua tetradactyla]|uniref:uncharacterized protein LOC143658646 isoform X4 n=1 Tax=Tamandua tetradactyla TaxID=48850 RepID=UPI0040548864
MQFCASHIHHPLFLAVGEETALSGPTHPAPWSLLQDLSFHQGGHGECHAPGFPRPTGSRQTFISHEAPRQACSVERDARLSLRPCPWLAAPPPVPLLSTSSPRAARPLRPPRLRLDAQPRRDGLRAPRPALRLWPRVWTIIGPTSVLSPELSVPRGQGPSSSRLQKERHREATVHQSRRNEQEAGWGVKERAKEWKPRSPRERRDPPCGTR